MKYTKALAIAEEATDELSHFVGEESLEKILESGYLKGSQYDIAKMNFKGSKEFKNIDDNPKELCLVRKGLATNPEALSGNSGTTRFLLDMENIKNIRHIKKPYPVAQLPVQNQRFIENELKELEEYGLDKTRLNLIKSSINHKPMLPPKEVEEKINSLFKNSRGNIVNISRSIISDYKVVYDKIRRREGEERLDLSKAVIPLSSKYFKIVLSANDLNDKIVELIKQKHQKDPNLFYNNNVLKKILQEK